MPNDTLLVPLSCDTVAFLLSLRRNDDNGLVAVIDRLARFHLPPVPDEREPAPRHVPEPISKRPRGKYRYHLLGEERAIDTLRELLVDVLGRLAARDTGFLQGFSEGQGRSRRFLARNPKAIYPGREDLSNYTTEVCGGWWVGTNYSRADVRRLLRAACDVAGLKWDVDLIVEF